MTKMKKHSTPDSIRLIFRSLTLTVATAMSMTLTTSCFDDDTTEGTRPLSEISITQGTILETYDLEKNDTLIIAPKVTQTNKQKPLSYTWEIDLEEYSHDSVFNYVGKTLGTYNCRLIVENEDGKTFYPFTLNVNSPYEEGITIISEDNEGRSRLSFMLAANEDSIGFTKGDCFSINNPDMAFASHPADIVQSSGSVIIACKGKGEGDDVATIYYLNEKTFVVENYLTATEYSDFKPTKLGIPSQDASGVAYPVLCENGKVYEFSTTEGALAEPVKLTSTYAQSAVIYDQGTGYYYSLLFWDKEMGNLALIYNGYGPYYCSKTYLLTRDNCNSSTNYFYGRDFVTMTMVKRTSEQSKTDNAMTLVITKNGAIYHRTLLFTSFWMYDSETLETTLYDNGGAKTCGFGNINIDDTTPCIANQTYYSFLFANGNKVMRWNYTSSQYLSNADVLQTVGSDNAVITGFELSQDHKRTYVAFYEPEQTGLNGSVWVIDTDKGTVLKKYDNVCYKPVKIMYKKK